VTTTADGGAVNAAGFPAGWLYTSGAKIEVSTGAGGEAWMGRGVNVDDIYFCGVDDTLSESSPDQLLTMMISTMIAGWKPNLIRISLGMDSYPVVSTWVGTDAKYKTPMTGVIQSILAHPDVYVLVTLRSDASMIGQDTADGDPEATGLPSDSMTTPNATMFPTGTDATYVALVDTFGTANNVLFGLTNEPGGDKLSNATIAAAMSHAVGVIRAEEDRLGVHHHIVSAQGQGWTSDIGFYATTPIAFDNVVYEIHGYPPVSSSYTYADIPVIIGEYGSLTADTATAFYADVEAKKIPNIAWDFDSYNDCAPDLVDVNSSSTMLMPSAWGMIVQAYLLAHPPP
jgi:Cellulase (glycosyl hydrolase family 5)